MADTKLSELTTEQTTLGATDRLYLSDGSDKYALPTTLSSHTGDVTGGIDGVLTIATNAVTTTKILDDAVTNAKLGNDSVANAQLQNNSVDTAEIAADAVTTAKILDANVTAAKLAADVLRKDLGTEAASFAFDVDDANNIVEITSASAVNATVNASIFSAGDQIDVIQYGAGQVTFVAGAGVTLRVASTLTLLMEEQYAGATLTFRSATEAVVTGQLELAP